MISFSMMVLRILDKGFPQTLFPEADKPIQAFFTVYFSMKLIKLVSK